MKPITEEQRQALIERLTKIASWAETYGPDHNVMLPASEAKEMAEAYIASLTAEPIGYCTRYDVEALQRGDAAGVSHAPNCHHPVYTAPPVPVIKFPNPHDIPDGYDLDSCMATVQWYQSEVKRLNVLEQT